MKPLSKPILLIGFKHVGKSVIGYELANRLGCSFVDLDEALENHYEEQNQKRRSCRDIMNTLGQPEFRALEIQLLRKILQHPPGVIALGGGTPLHSDTHTLLKGAVIIHIQAPKNLVFSRIMKQGEPAFFPETEAPFVFFQTLWQERIPIYQKLAHHTIKNEGTLESAIGQALTYAHSRIQEFL